jgi:hypothetical protein
MARRTLCSRVSQVLWTIAQFEKGGRKSYAEARPEMVELARQLRRPDPDRRPVSLRKVSAALAERGDVASTGKPYEAAAVAATQWEPACSRSGLTK